MTWRNKPSNTQRILHRILNTEERIMATVEDIKAKLDQLVAQEAGETNLAPGQVAVAQSDIDALDSQVAGLIDAAPAPGPVNPPA